VDEAPEDDEARETYNFPPGSYGLVYRADVPDSGVRDEDQPAPSDGPDESSTPDESLHEAQQPPQSSQTANKKYKYQIKVMKWGLIPFWTKRSPDYGSMLRTINCRDDSLLENRGMWTTMKQRKRCLVIAQGFYEWLKKGPGGKERIPYFVKRKDDQLMCFAGLWDCVKYEDAEQKLYTYTIITTDANKQLSFLHDRMPVILDPGTDAVKMWLDPTRNKWSKELQALLKPYEGELECYPVSKEVGKVGNNSPDFIVPLNSKENKKNIANFFDKAKKPKDITEDREYRATVNHDGTEDHPPVAVSPAGKGQKRSHTPDPAESPMKTLKKDSIPPATSPVKPFSGKKPKSATSNDPIKLKSSPKKKTEPGMQRITNFFVK